MRKLMKIKKDYVNDLNCLEFENRKLPTDLNCLIHDYEIDSVPDPLTDEKKAKNFIRESFRIGLRRICLAIRIPITEHGRQKDLQPPYENSVIMRWTKEALANEMSDGKLWVDVFQRLTLVVNETSNYPYINSKDCQKYDVVAVETMSTKMLQKLCAMKTFDLLSIKLYENEPVFLKYNVIRQLCKNENLVELNFGPTLENQLLRQQMIAIANRFIHICGSKNLILSSGTQNALLQRTLFEMVSICKLWNVQETSLSLMEKSTKVLNKAFIRLHPSGVSVTTTDEIM
ncbi:hypothetical protein SNEBB_006970 [Seison nebaliae]|nr:hypothetical protein SNEBB_006970 [Seison nebaliae]